MIVSVCLCGCVPVKKRDNSGIENYFVLEIHIWD